MAEIDSRARFNSEVNSFYYEERSDECASELAY
jgi:hypothetical protein